MRARGWKGKELGEERREVCVDHLEETIIIYALDRLEDANLKRGAVSLPGALALAAHEESGDSACKMDRLLRLDRSLKSEGWTRGAGTSRNRRFPITKPSGTSERWNVYDISPR